VTAGWREIAPEALGSGAREYVRIQQSLVWVYDETLAGAKSVRGTTEEEAREHWRCYRALAANLSRPLDFVNDVREVLVPGSEATALAAILAEFTAGIAAVSTFMGRQAGIVPRDWSALWWPSLNAHAGATWPVASFYEPDEAWAWLGTPPEVATEVDAFIAVTLQVPHPRAVVIALRATLRAEPGFDLAGAARALSLSSRTLQRALSAAGETFTEIRERVRLDRAYALLREDTVKIESIAGAIGFASTTHFTAWFRKRAGVTPSRFREAR